MLNNFINKFKDTITNLTVATKYDEIKNNEIKFMVFILSPMMIFASIFCIFLAEVTKISLVKEVIFSVGIFICALLLFFCSNKNIETKMRTHFIGIIISIAVALTFFCYYEVVGVLFWFVGVIIIAFVSHVTDVILHVYVIIDTIVLFMLSVLVFPFDIIKVDAVFNTTLFVLLSFIALVSIVSNYFYRKITKNKIEKFVEITELNEEISASEEELREQNEIIKKNNERLEYLAYKDTLTGLPNRKMILEQLEVLLELGKENNKNFAVVMIDVDNFKRVNDSFGHSAGDKFLKKFIEYISEGLNKRDMLGRLGGDELILLIRRRLSDEEILSYVQNLCNLVDKQFDLGGNIIKITASFGIVVCPKDAEEISEVLKAADAAMYKAKELGKNNVQFYHQKMKSEILYRIELEDKLLKAFEKNQFYLEYQPLFKSGTKEVACFEALIRWRDSDNKIVSPLEFIPFAEEMGIINEIGEWVIRTVCRKIKEIKTQLDQEIYIAVNVSPVQMQSENFLNKVRMILDEEKINPENLELEITESVFIDNKKKAVEQIEELRKMGLKVAMDDFGTGFSSLSYLLELPIDKLKIDRTFINEIRDKNNKSIIVNAIIQMVHSLDIKVVAEGVETVEQMEYLRDEKCDLLQGFYLSRPLNDYKMKELLIKKDS